ncbi:hypothetical protein EP331_10465 [bacterium]|nr:MAG: hypothetical protein EP331_10465 [bacterium]
MLTPQQFRFEITDSVSGVNLVANKTIDLDSLVIYDTISEKIISYRIITDYDLYLIHIPGIGNISETKNLEFRYRNFYLFRFYVEAEVKDEDCIYTKINKAQVLDSKYIYRTEYNIYTILFNKEKFDSLF